jgi:hypothetical protein
MTSQSTVQQDDPLTSALPPATDYMTYLTLLEYQLSPTNLHTLNRLLGEDDGTLAEEIGWDLLKLVLPMLAENPVEATRTLEIVSRRGNPREVVVRVAEELEKLGDQDTDSFDQDLETGAEQDELPTFAGEAPRVHLGQMTLEGMPDANTAAEAPIPDAVSHDASATGSVKSLQLHALFMMLSILHPRIQTQYPSRFLATSLPAALGAYRTLAITTVTTSAFLSMLEALAGGKRPQLPPRPGTQSAGAVPTSTTAAPLPDPESKAEEQHTGVSAPSATEKSIIMRLLNAVLLEVLDEYFSSFAAEDVPSMSWTPRLREQLEPRRVVPGRMTEADLWKQSPGLTERDALLQRFDTVSRQMQVDTGSEIRKLIYEDEEDLSGNPYHDEEEPSEYPTSPAQIPFPRAGVIYIHAYHSFLDPADSKNILTITEMCKIIAHSFPLSATPAIPLPTLQDALLSLLYPHVAVSAEPNIPQPSPAKFLLLLSTLTQLFAISPYPTLRDATHYVATRLLHAYPDSAVRLRVIKQTLVGSTLSTNWAEIDNEEVTEGQKPPTEPEIVEETGLTRSTSARLPHPIPLGPPQQMGQLAAVGVDWLKQEFATWIAAKATQGRDNSSAPIMSPGALDPNKALSIAEPSPAAVNDSDEASTSSPVLVDLLFPTDLPSLPTATSTPTPESAAHDASILPDFLASIPFYISTLNLLCIVVPHLQLETSATLRSRITKHVDSLNRSSRFLVEVLDQARKKEEATGENTFEESRADIFALEDACVRAVRICDRIRGS